MKKLIIMASVLILLITSLLILLYINKEETVIDEEVYCIKSNYAYLSSGKTNLNIKLYSNDKNSILGFATEADARLHDRSSENILSVKINESYIKTTAMYKENIFYEYNLLVEIDITSFIIDDCYLTLDFPEKSYVFNIGRVELKERPKDLKQLNVTNLYGLSSVDDISLKGIVITLKNTNNFSWKVDDVNIGDNCQVLLDNSNQIQISEDTTIETYKYKDVHLNGYLLVPHNESKTFILPIQKNSDIYLYNCYLLLEINGNKYYISNFDYINTNDLFTLEKYITSGLIYDF